MDKLNVNALFLGPKSENQDFFKEMLNFMMNDFIDWRKDFHPQDKPIITDSDKDREDYKSTLLKTRHTLVDLAGKLQTCSMPWFSPRYLGHMNTDTLMAANLGYMLTLLYNPNNCAYEGSPVTTELEIELGKQLAGLLGYDPKRSWGHITSGGTIANYEGLWVARNLKSIPHAIKKVLPELVGEISDWQLSNLTSVRVLDLLDEVKVAGKFEDILRLSARGTGVLDKNPGKLLVPQSKHYSWVKAMDILGIGTENLINIKVKDNYRMDIEDLKNTIEKLTVQKIPILAVVGVVGSTEEGAIDEIHEIVRIRREFEEKGISFYLHIDAAYGGYARAMVLDENNKFLEYDDLISTLKEQRIIAEDTDWPSPEVHKAFKFMGEADSITIDPHKMGYVPYATGAIVMKDKRILDLISYFAAYVFDKSENNPLLLGSYIMEGSKAGATVAATWCAHKIIPLNFTGYGRIIGCGITGAQRFYRTILKAGSIIIAGRKFQIKPLTLPDFNMVDFAFNEIGNKDLTAMNELNQKIYELCSYKSGPVYLNDFITSKTALSEEEYGNTPGKFVMDFGIPWEEWEKVKSVYVMRSSIITPFLVNDSSPDGFMNNFLKTMKEKITKIIS